MSRVLRGAWSRRGALTTLVLMALVVVGGTVLVLQFAEAAHTSRWLAAPLLLIGAVAVPSIGAELAVARREEIGLARLRGIHGLRLWRFLLVEPLLAILVGTALGLAVGSFGTVVATRTWLAATAPALEQRAVLVALAIAGAGLLIVGLSAAAALREPLAVQVAARRRPRRATTLTVFLSVLVLVGTVVAAYRSRDAAGDPDLVVLLGPALVGLALGQAAIWAVRLAARGLTPTTQARGVGAFLAARRLARADDLVTPVRLVVAAAVVGALALSGSVAVDGWTREQTAIDVPGARTIDATALGALGAVELTDRVDPEGEHLLATAIVPNEGRLAERRAYVDADRWGAVVGDFYDGTPAGAASSEVERLRTDTRPLLVVGDRLTVDATALQLPVPPAQRPVVGGSAPPPVNGFVVAVSYVSVGNVSGTATVTVRMDRVGRPARATTRVRDCVDGCFVNGFEVSRDLSGIYGIDRFRVLASSIRFGDHDLAQDVWVPDPLSVDAALGDRYLDPDQIDRNVLVNRPDGLQLSLLPASSLRLLDQSLEDDVPALTTRASQELDAAGDADDGGPTVLDLGGDDRPADVIGVDDVLPLVGTVGVVSDLRTSAAGAGRTVPSAEVQVIAADGTPQAMLDEVGAATDTSWRTFGTVRSSLGERYGGAQSVAYALTALACALVALLALGAGVARHLRDYRRDVASLRLLGISMGTARQAGRAELVSLTGLVLVAVTAGGWLAVRLLLGGLPLLTVPVAGLPLDTAPHAWPLAIPAVVSAAAVVLVGGRARAVRATSTRPSQLREEER
ncbi:ABC transporter permease [Nocardioides hwasunensis]|uniref:ABC transporter permease n=1 Tax=Nocardioides hwasunensis TaxID=397258 RepID=A0ABR8ML59_9ACTN|nr:ABC transporter permease [Nocardioides hwasunensis]MBD3916742.1 ABC transporter permease [Nocardioides hwasunensis]